MYLSNNIRALRFASDEMTQEELGVKAGVTRQTIVAIEKSKYSPSLELAFKIAAVFGLPICDVFSYSEEPTFQPVHKNNKEKQL